MPSDPRWLDAEATARYISVRIDALPRLVRQGRIPKGIEVKGRSGLWWSADGIDGLLSGADSGSWKRNETPEALSLKSVDEILSTAIPKAAVMIGVYFLIKDGTIVYVGQSTDICARIAQHVGVKDFDSWAWVACPCAELNATELAYILALKPALNVMFSQCWLRTNV